MKIGVVGYNYINTSVPVRKNAPCGRADAVSFKGAGDTFEKTIPTFEEMVDSVSALGKKLNAKLAEHISITGPMSKRAIEIQNAEVPEGKIGFKRLLEMFNDPKSLKPVADMYETVEGDQFSRMFSSFSRDVIGAGSIMFMSEDKKLADDVADMCGFYLKARYDQETCARNFFDFRQMYTRGYGVIDSSVVTERGGLDLQQFLDIHQNAMIDEMDRSLAEYNRTGRPSFIAVRDLEALIDREFNAPENIASMKEYINTAVGDNKCMLMYGAHGPVKKSIEPACLKSNRLINKIDIDAFGVTAEKIELLKRARADLSPQIKGIQEAFEQIRPVDTLRLNAMFDNWFEYYKMIESIKETYPEQYVKFCPLLESKTYKFFRIDPDRFLDSLPDDLKPAVQTVRHTVEHTVEQTAEQIVQESPVQTVKEAVKGAVQQTVDNAGRIIKDTAEQLGDNVGQTIKETVEQAVQSTGRAVEETAEQTAERIIKNTDKNELLKKVKNAFGKIFTGKAAIVTGVVGLSVIGAAAYFTGKKSADKVE